MKRIFLSTLLAIVLALSAHAQSVHHVSGKIVDSDLNHPLKNTSVSVLRAKDSVLLGFTRVDEQGLFRLKNLPKGSMLLMVTYPTYADYFEAFILDSAKTSHDFGTLKLTLKATLLANVIIKGTAAAIKIKGDTTEFNASAYTIQPNSKVEDLLKQLPGIMVDKDGKITAQGQTVTKVLVDGEEFFGDDPTLVTKNIRGDMVDKVQLYDKKSDQAAFTGIDDGKKDKTINIQLKEDKKNGYFGKIDVAGGTDEYYQTQAMFNAFKGKKKLSLYGTLANTGKVGLGWNDAQKYGSSSFEVSDEGFFFSSGGGDALDSFSGNYDNEGLPTARNGGAHYDAKWNKDKESVNANYKIGSLNVNGNKNTITQNNLPTGTFNSTSDENLDNYLFRQKADVKYEVKLDTTSTIKIGIEGTLRKSETSSLFDARSVRGNDIRLNESHREIANDVDDKSFNGSLLWTKKMRKPRRTLSVNLSQALSEKNGNGYLRSENTYYDITGALDSTSLINQNKDNLVKTSVFNSNIVFTEPLSRDFSLILNYGFGVNNSSSNLSSYNIGLQGENFGLDSAFSNNYKLNQILHQGGAIVNYKTSKTTLNFGTKVSEVSFDQQNFYTGGTLNRSFFNWRPQVNLRYKLAAQKNLGFNYNGSTEQPSIDQIQPIRINTDPLNITVGNPNLKPSFRHNISVNYSSYKVLSSQNIYGYASYNNTANPIVFNTVTDSAGKSTFNSVNIDRHATSFSLYGGYSQKIKALDIVAGLNLGIERSTSYNYINTALNKLNSSTYTPTFYLYKTKEKKYDIYLSYGPQYRTNESSVQSNINDNGWGANGNGSFNIYLPGKFEIGAESQYEYRAASQSFNTSFSRVILNGRLSRKFLKSDALKISVSGNDLLNQNVGFRRTAWGNVISQNSYTTIRRYFMASVSWDFSKMGGAVTK